jgi:hypothetical protein
MSGSVSSATAQLWTEGAGFFLAMALMFYLIHYSVDHLAIKYDDGDEEKQRKERRLVWAILAASGLVLLLIVKVVVFA